MRVERFIEIEAPVERVFDLLGDFEVVPRWMRNIREVYRTGRRTTHWIAEGPDGREIEWEVETTHFQPDRRIVWRSVDGDVDTDGEAVLEEIARHTTLLRLVLGFYPTGSTAGIAAARLFGRDPERRLAEDLERFRSLAEGRTDDRRRGRDDDEWAGRARPRARRDADFYRRDEQEWRERRGDGRGREMGFEQAQREARRSQTEGMRRYREEREREEELRRRPPERVLGERRREDYADDEPVYRRDDEPEDRPRYALTPRERERERAERGFDQDYSRRIMRRGVERLLEDPPSKHWRRWD